MNALIKVIITSIIGFIGPLETNEDTRLHVNAENGPVLEFLYIDPEANIYCRFDEFLCKKLNNNISPG